MTQQQQISQGLLPEHQAIARVTSAEMKISKSNRPYVKLGVCLLSGPGEGRNFSTAYLTQGSFAADFTTALDLPLEEETLPRVLGREFRVRVRRTTQDGVDYMYTDLVGLTKETP